MQSLMSVGTCAEWKCCEVTREDKSRWQQQSKAEGVQADWGVVVEEEDEEEEERRVWSWSISPLLESSMETAEGGGGTMALHTLVSVFVYEKHLITAWWCAVTPYRYQPKTDSYTLSGVSSIRIQDQIMLGFNILMLIVEAAKGEL